jgi:RNA polymerase sigma factor (sigma-70 family)
MSRAVCGSRAAPFAWSYDSLTPRSGLHTQTRSTDLLFVRLLCMTRSAWQMAGPPDSFRGANAGSLAQDDAPSRDAFVEVLFRQHYADLLRLAYCLMGDRSQAEDAVQDAFVSLCAHWGGLRDPAAAPSYLRSAVIYRCRSTIRTLIRDRIKPGVRPTEESADSSEDAAMAHDDASRLVAAVQQLPRRQREVVVCRYFLELSVAETAMLLEIAVGSVKRHAHRGIGALAARVGQVTP